MSPPLDIDALSPAELKSLVLKLFEEAAELRRLVGVLRDEIARLKGAPGRPDIKANVKPSGMEKASEPPPSAPESEPPAPAPAAGAASAGRENAPRRRRNRHSRGPDDDADGS